MVRKSLRRALCHGDGMELLWGSLPGASSRLMLGVGNSSSGLPVTRLAHCTLGPALGR